MPRVLVAPDKFKGSLTALGVAEAVAAGVRRHRPDAEVGALPVADGGDGTLDAALANGFERVDVVVSGPTGDPVRTAYARRGDTAVVEMADACGLSRLPGGTLQGLTASSRGLGDAVAAALDAGCREVVVGIGGSASTDGGAGLVSALGAVLLDEDGGVLPDGGAALARLHALDLTDLHPALRETTLVVACDVDNPLTGPRGAAAVYGPQKGLTPDDVPVLDAALTRWADLVGDATGADRRDTPGAGAAGGVGFAAVALLGATLCPGITLMLDLLGFGDVVGGYDLVVTGEGSLDEQSLHGKAPIGVAEASGKHGVPVVAVCGRRLLDTEALEAAGIGAAYALLDVEPDAATCMSDAARLLEVLGERIAARHLG
ncbi:glycerate kinase [Nocardioides iriomotensis]|uniref:Glycerate kinase n=1 Tax=Nocardioides iriomotensis TaxID=715784 RepID=A0A4Q5J2P7_9ACTN|nr:glycerate kinase [Nocardioides iriomotensis]RYU11769.1 glycerate kinase [Nocardioides iriomotensis]